MIYNAGWANLKPQETKYTYALAVKAAHQLHVRKYKEVAQEIVNSARDGAADPVEAGAKAHQQAKAG